MLLGNGLLLVWWDIEAEIEEDFNSWHLREHVPERVGLSGFIRGRRYMGVDSRPKYFTLYETESAAVFSSQPYLDRLNNPTPWTHRVMPNFRNMKRSTSRAVATMGLSDGGTIATIELRPKRPLQSPSVAATNLLPSLLSLPGIVAVHLCAPVRSHTGQPTKEEQLRVQPDANAPWVILIEAASPTDVPAAYRLLLGDKDLAKHAEVANVPGIYQLSFALANEANPLRTGPP